MEIDRVERNHRENSGEKRRYFKFCCEKTCDDACKHSGNSSNKDGGKRVRALYKTRRGCSCAKREAAFYGEVGYVQHAEREVYAECEDGP